MKNYLQHSQILLFQLLRCFFPMYYEIKTQGVPVNLVYLENSKSRKSFKPKNYRAYEYLKLNISNIKLDAV